MHLLNINMFAPKTLVCLYSNCLLLRDVAKCWLEACIIVGPEAFIAGVRLQKKRDAIIVIKKSDSVKFREEFVLPPQIGFKTATQSNLLIVTRVLSNKYKERLYKYAAEANNSCIEIKQACW